MSGWCILNTDPNLSLTSLIIKGCACAIPLSCIPSLYPFGNVYSRTFLYVLCQDDLFDIEYDDYLINYRFKCPNLSEKLSHLNRTVIWKTIICRLQIPNKNNIILVLRQHHNCILTNKQIANYKSTFFAVMNSLTYNIIPIRHFKNHD